MNKSFKVVFSKARGALMVANELTSSVQAKGTKTIIAAAVTALMAGGAMAADVWTDRVITEDLTIAAGQTEVVNSAVMKDGTLSIQGVLDYDSKNSKGDFALQGGTINVSGGASMQVRDFVMTGGKITAAGEATQDDPHGRTAPAVGAYNSWRMTGGDIELSKGGRIWIGSSSKNDPTAYGRMALQGGTVSLKDGGYITGNKRLIEADKYYEGTVVVPEATLAGNTIGFDGATVKVDGTGNVIDALYTEQTRGVVTVGEGADLTVRATTSTNNDTDEARRAIQENSRWTIAGGEFVNKGKVTVDVRELLVSGGKVSLEKGSLIVWDSASEATLDKARLKVTGGEIVLADLAGVEMRAVEIAGGHIAVGGAQGGQEGAGAGNSARTSPSLGGYHEFTMSAGTVDLGNNGRLWIGSAAKETLGYQQMRLLGGVINMNGTKDYQSWITGTVTEKDPDQSKEGNDVVLGGTTLNVNGHGEVNAAQIFVDGSTINVAQNGVLTFGSTYSHNSDNKGQEYTNGTLTLESGVLNVSGLLKSEIATEVTGDFTMTDVTVGAATTAPTSGFHFGKTLTVTDGTTTVTGKLANAESSLTLSGGVLSVNAASIFNADWEGLDADTTKIGGTEGTLEVNFNGASLTKDQLSMLKTAIYDGRWSALGLTVSDFKPQEDGTISAEDSLLVGDEIASDYAIGAGKDGKLTSSSVSGQVDVSKVTASEGKKTVSVEGEDVKTVTLIGKAGALTNEAGKVDFSVSENKTLEVGSAAVTNGAIRHEGDITGLGTLEVLNTDLTVSNIAIATTNVKADAVVKADTVTTSGAVDGTLVANTVNGSGDQGLKVAGAMLVNGKTVDGKVQDAVSGNVTVAEEGVIATNLAGAQKFAAMYHAWDIADGETDPAMPAILYVDKQLKVASTAAVAVGAAIDGQSVLNDGAKNVTIGGNGVLAVDASAFVQTPAVKVPLVEEAPDLSVFGDTTTIDASNGEIVLVNVNKIGMVDLGGAVTAGADLGQTIDTDSIYVVVDKDATSAALANGVVVLGYNQGLISNETVDARLGSLFAKGASGKEMSILEAIQANEAFYTDGDGAGNAKFTAAGEAAFKQAASGNVTAGVLNVAYDANAQVTDAIVRHQLALHQGMGAWADVFYASNEAKNLYGDSGYEADIYGGVFGFDATFSCGATAGLALTVGTADADSVGGVVKTSVDSDFWGLSVYASKDFAGLNVKADLGYIDFSNDVSGLGDASDASTITFGIRGDYAAYTSDLFSIVPHVGLRFTKIDTDSVAFNDDQDMNVFEAPVGVKFAGNFEAQGWKVLPAVDFTIVPQLGDKEIEAFGYADDVTVLSGGLYNTTVGVEAQNGNLSFGLNAAYGFGPDERANTQLNANVRYMF